MGVVDQLKNLTKELEGPTALRVVSAGCGVSLMACSVLSLFPITDALLDFNTLFLKVHAGLCGFVILCVEMKDLQKLSKFHNMFIKWFPFLTVLWGKGGLMIFAGSLGAAFFSKLVMFIPCMVTIAVGVINMLMYFGKMEQYDKAYDKSMKMATQMYTEYAPVGQHHDDAGQRGYDFSAPHQHNSKPQHHSKPQPHAKPQYQSKFSDTSGSY